VNGRSGDPVAVLSESMKAKTFVTYTVSRQSSRVDDHRSPIDYGGFVNICSSIDHIEIESRYSTVCRRDKSNLARS
jgi:hypothetical protein